MHEEVVCFLIISIGDELYTVVKKGEVESDIIGVCLFPFQFAVGIVARIEACAPNGSSRCHGDSVGIRAGPLVTYDTPTQTELQRVDGFYIFQECLVVDFPCQCYRREPAPAALFGKRGRTIGTEGGSQEITIIEIVVQTSEVGFNGRRTARTAGLCRCGIACIQFVYGVEKEVGTTAVQRLVLVFLCFVSQHGGEAVFAEIIVVCKVSFQCPVASVAG